MASNASTSSTLTVRPLQYRDLDTLKQWTVDELDGGDLASTERAIEEIERLCRWYGPLKALSLMPNPLRQALTVFVAEQNNQLLGLIQVAPFNRGRSTWQVKHIIVNRAALSERLASGFIDVGSRLLRYCFDKVWEARTWVIETDINNTSALALYRFNGFQPLAQLTYWSISAEQLATLADREPDLPNLLPVSNADAQLLYQLDTASMPPLVRQVFDHQIQDFKTQPVEVMTTSLERWRKQAETVSAYVFEHQRKAAIGYFKLVITKNGQQPHQADLMVHPAYTWLYPELMAQMARIVQPFPAEGLRLASLDYQPEREEYLNQIQASPQDHSLLMSRSVWHKVRESRPLSLEGLQLSDVLSSLKPAGKPIPSRISWFTDQVSSFSTGQSFPANSVRKGQGGRQIPGISDRNFPPSRFEASGQEEPEDVTDSNPSSLDENSAGEQ